MCGIWNILPNLIIAIVAAVATIALAVITFKHLGVAEKMRKITLESVQADISPKVFINKINTLQELAGGQNKRLLLYAEFKIKNVGKTEAKDIRLSYTMTVGALKVEQKMKPSPYIFQTQELTSRTYTIGIPLDDDMFVKAQEMVTNIHKVILPPNYGPKVTLNVILRYKDHKEKEQEYLYFCEYLYDGASWSFLVAPEETNNET